jgi:hypothetical protein
MCDVLLPPGVNPTAVKYIYHIISYIISFSVTSVVPFGVPILMYWSKSNVKTEPRTKVPRHEGV